METQDLMLFCNIVVTRFETLHFSMFSWQYVRYIVIHSLFIALWCSVLTKTAKTCLRLLPTFVGVCKRYNIFYLTVALKRKRLKQAKKPKTKEEMCDIHVNNTESQEIRAPRWAFAPEIPPGDYITLLVYKFYRYLNICFFLNNLAPF